VLTFRLNSSSGVPPYLQIAQQIRQALIAEVFLPGDQVPTVKEVVAQVAVNPNTVFKSYRELEREGLVQGRPGAGTFVLRRPDGPAPRDHARLVRALDQWVASARAAGIDDASIEAMVCAALNARDEAIA
jgi:GntR family transcriptional regulator